MPPVEWRLRDVGPEFVKTAPYRCTSSAVLQAPPGTVFDALTRDPSEWGRWNPGFSTKGGYTTPPPHGAGAVREVVMAGVRYRDTIFVWDEPDHWAFCVSHAGAPFARALAEDYLISARGSGTVLQWTIAMEPRLALKALRPLMDVFLPRYFKKAMSNLDAWLAGEGARAGG